MTFLSQGSNEPKLGNHKSYPNFIKYSAPHTSFSMITLFIIGNLFTSKAIIKCQKLLKRSTWRQINSTARNVLDMLGTFFLANSILRRTQTLQLMRSIPQILLWLLTQKCSQKSPIYPHILNIYLAPPPTPRELS